MKFQHAQLREKGESTEGKGGGVLGAKAKGATGPGG